MLTKLGRCQEYVPNRREASHSNGLQPGSCPVHPCWPQPVSLSCWEQYLFVVWILHAPHMQCPSATPLATLLCDPPLTNGSGILSRVTTQVTSFNHACKVYSLRTRVYVLSRFQFNSPCMNGTEEVGIEYQEFRLWTGTQRAGKRHHNKLIFAS